MHPLSMEQKQQFDVVVIGGGASGLMAAVVAGEQGKHVLLLEKNQDLGAKLRITGGGRCNILNAETDTRALLAHYGDAAKFLHSPFAAFPMQAAWDFFSARGLPLTVAAGKRAFPESEVAEDVVNFFEQRLKKHHVVVKTGVTVHGFLKKDGALVGVRTSEGVMTAAAYILATGGLSHPETGSTGEGLRWLRELGHDVVDPNPSLVPLLVPDAWVQALAGTALSDVSVTFGVGDETSGKKAKPFSRRGKLLFTHFGLSGPMILNAAQAVQGLLTHGEVKAHMDLLPHENHEVLAAKILDVFTVHKNKALKNVIKYVVPPGMSSAVAALLSPELAETKVHSVLREARYGLATRIKAMPFSITGTKDNDWSIVSDGGLVLTEVDTKTMRSKRYQNLFVTGDILHISRPSGGYSLQLCWTTGYVAGSSV